jgi:hypothetical protein
MHFFLMVRFSSGHSERGSQDLSIMAQSPPTNATIFLSAHLWPMFQLLIPRLTEAGLLKSVSGFEIVMQLADTRNKIKTIVTSIVHALETLHFTALLAHGQQARLPESGKDLMATDQTHLESHKPRTHRCSP